jgi:hypothetical protein
MQVSGQWQGYCRVCGQSYCDSGTNVQATPLWVALLSWLSYRMYSKESESRIGRVPSTLLSGSDIMRWWRVTYVITRTLQVCILSIPWEKNSHWSRNHCTLRASLSSDDVPTKWFRQSTLRRRFMEPSANYMGFNWRRTNNDTNTTDMIYKTFQVTEILYKN